MAEAIEMSFASTTLVGPGKHLLHIADRFGRILYCVHSTQYSLLVGDEFLLLDTHLKFTLIMPCVRICVLPLDGIAQERAAKLLGVG